jgi:hypothetical protein
MELNAQSGGKRSKSRKTTKSSKKSKMSKDLKVSKSSKRSKMSKGSKGSKGVKKGGRSPVVVANNEQLKAIWAYLNEKKLKPNKASLVMGYLGMLRKKAKKELKEDDFTGIKKYIMDHVKSLKPDQLLKEINNHKK